MKRISLLPLIVILYFFTACKPAQMMVSDQFSTQATVMEVEGRQGFRIKQVIRFGEYATSKIKRGWTVSYDIPFVVRFRGAKEKLSYSIGNSANQKLSVFCSSKFKEKEVGLLNDFFSLSVDYQNTFAGSIVRNEQEEVGSFIVYDPNGGGIENTTRGILNFKKKKIEIVGVRQLAGQKATWLNTEVYGYEFQENGKTIGAVSIINKGRVWMLPQLESELKLALAAVSTGLMVRNNVEEVSGNY